jgi:hypothetical protein
MGRASRTACALPGDHPRPRPPRPPPAGRRGRPRRPMGVRSLRWPEQSKHGLPVARPREVDHLARPKNPFFLLPLLELRDKTPLACSGQASLGERSLPVASSTTSSLLASTGADRGQARLDRARPAAQRAAPRALGQRTAAMARAKRVTGSRAWVREATRVAREVPPGAQGCEWKRGDGGVRRARRRAVLACLRRRFP